MDARRHRDGGAAEVHARHVGVEEELLLVDAETLRPVPLAGRILEATSAAGATETEDGIPTHPVLQAEVKHEQIEVASAPLRTLDELRAAIVAGRHVADDAARPWSARAVALATAPVACASHVVSEPRYEWMAQRFGVTMVDQLTCGFHVHVSVASRDEGVAVLDRIRPWLPMLLALSANSPYWGGIDSGFASYRAQAWGRWPSAGPYDRHGTVDAYDATVAAMLQTGVALDEGMVYFDARLSGHAPTVEVRVADVCLDAEDAAVIAVLVRALVDTAAAEWRAGVAADDVSTGVLRLASWQASRYGLEAELVHPGLRSPRPAAECIEALLEHVTAHFATRDEAESVRRGVADILARGSGAAQQRRAVAQDGIRTAAIALAVSRTHAAPGENALH